MANDLSGGALSGQPSAVGQNVTTVSDYASLMAALGSAGSGDTILLQGGNYGDVRLEPGWQFNFTGDVTIQAADPNDPPIFDTIVFNQVSNITLSGVHVHRPSTANAVGWDAAIRMLDSHDIVIDNVTITGEPSINGIPANSPLGTTNPTGTIQGYYYGDGIRIQTATNITIQNSDISNVGSGMRTAYVDGLNVLNNDIHDIRTTPIAGAAVDNVLIDGNHTWDSNPWNLGGVGDHGDMIHLWTVVGAQSGPSSNITITNNFFEQGNGESILGIYLDDKNRDLGFDNVTIANNVIVNGDQQGIRLENVDNSRIVNNTLLDPEGDIGNSPGIIILTNSENTVIDKNIVSSVTVYSDSQATVAVGDNLIVQRDYPNQPGYYDTLFANALTSVPTLGDVVALPGSIVAQGNYGASQTQPNLTPSGLTGFVQDTGGTGLASLAHQFDASLLYNASGAVSANNASVSWDFGDGTSGSGVQTNHVYSSAGFYDVVATVTLGNGQSTTVNKTVKVDEPYALLTDFDNGVQDLSTDTNALISMDSSVQVVSDNGGKALDLNGGKVVFARSSDLVDNDAYTLLLDFRKDQLSDSGTLIDFPGTFSLAIGSTNMQAYVSTSAGTDWFQPTNLNINDTNWHQVAITFSSATGEAAMYLDGQKIGSFTGHLGAIQYGNTSHDFSIGGGFDGRVDNVSFLNGALTSQEMAALHSGGSLNGIIAGYLGTPSFQVVRPVVNTTTPTTNTNTTTDTGSNTNTNTNTNTDSSTSTDTGTSTDSGSGTTTASGSTNDGGSTTTTTTTNTTSTDGGSTGSTDTGSTTTTTTSDTGSTSGGTTTTNTDDGGSTTTTATPTPTTGATSGSVIQNPNDGGPIRGTSADDQIIAGSGGWVRIDGKNGADTYVFDGGIAQDGTTDQYVLRDYKAGEDLIDLNGATISGVVERSNTVILELEGGNDRIHVRNVSSFDDLDFVGNAQPPTTTSSTAPSNPVEVQSQVAGVQTQPTIQQIVNSSQINVEDLGNRVAVDSNGDGATDQVVMLSPDTTSPTSTPSAVADPSFLSVSSATDFTVTLKSGDSGAGYANSLGVYEVDGNGNISDVRLLTDNVQNGGSFVVNDVDAGSSLGFFIIKDGYNRLDNGVLSSNDLSLNVNKKGFVKLTEGGDKVGNNKVFVSHDSSMNADRMDHVVFDVDPADPNGLQVSFEDTMVSPNSNDDFQDVVFTVATYSGDLG